MKLPQDVYRKMDEVTVEIFRDREIKLNEFELKTKEKVEKGEITITEANAEIFKFQLGLIIGEEDEHN